MSKSYGLMPIETLQPEYGLEVILRGLDFDGKPVHCVAVWVKKGQGGYSGKNGYTDWKVWDAWQLTEIGGYAEDANVSFEPTHWAPLPDEPDMDQG